MSSTIIQADLQSLQPSALIELFVLDTTSLGGTPVYFHAGTNGLQQPIVWQGQTYQPYPIQVTGFELTGQGALPKPTMSVSNVGGLISALVMQYDDLVGAKLTRKRTFAQYLDAINSGGSTLTFATAPAIGSVVSADYADGTSVALGTGDGVSTIFYSQGQVPTAVWITDWQGKVRRYSTARTNTLRQSAFQSGWSLGGSGTTTLTPNYGASPDGTSTAAMLGVVAGGSQYIYQSQSWVAGGSYSISVFAKMVGYSTLAIQSFQQSGSATFNISSGALTGITGSCSAQSIVALANGWYRCSATFQATSTGSNNIGFGTYGSSFTGNAFLLAAGQHESIQNGFSGSWITSSGESITQNATTAPDGSTTGSLLTTDGGSEYFYQGQTWAQGNSYTLSIFAKMAGYSTLAIQSFQQGGSASFNLSTGTTSGISGTCISQSILSVGGGWYRCSATFTATGTGANNVGFGTYSSSFVGDAFYFWSPRSDGGYTPTSYIPTASSAVTVTDFSSAAGANPTANGSAGFDDDVWWVHQKTSENKQAVTFQLASVLDVSGVTLPGRQILANCCSWQYRTWNGTGFDYSNATCPYTGSAMFDANGNPVTSGSQDKCSLQLISGCGARYPGGVTVPFGGFPAARRFS